MIETEEDDDPQLALESMADVRDQWIDVAIKLANALRAISDIPIGDTPCEALTAFDTLLARDGGEMP